MNQIKLTSLLLAIGTCLLIPLTAHSFSWDQQVDCSSAKEWSVSDRYKKDDVAIYGYGFNRDRSLFRCKKDECMGGGENEPGSTMGNGDFWEHLGLCK